MITKYMRVLGYILILSNMIYQIGAILKPLPGSNQLVVNICYIINSVIQIVLMMLSYTNNVEKNSDLIFTFWINVILR